MLNLTGRKKKKDLNKALFWLFGTKGYSEENSLLTLHSRRSSSLMAAYLKALPHDLSVVNFWGMFSLHNLNEETSFVSVLKSAFLQSVKWGG